MATDIQRRFRPVAVVRVCTKRSLSYRNVRAEEWFGQESQEDEGPTAA